MIEMDRVRDKLDTRNAMKKEGFIQYLLKNKVKFFKIQILWQSNTQDQES